jgi:hypothetical protein
MVYYIDVSYFHSTTFDPWFRPKTSARAAPLYNMEAILNATDYASRIQLQLIYPQS